MHMTRFPYISPLIFANQKQWCLDRKSDKWSWLWLFIERAKGRLSYCIPWFWPTTRWSDKLQIGILACVASVSVRFRSKELGMRVKDRAKNGASKRAGRGKKGRKCLHTNPEILKTTQLACHACVRAPTFDAVISCHNWPIKCLAFSGAEMNFRGRVCEPNNTWTAFMLKYQWIRTINTGFGHLSF